MNERIKELAEQAGVGQYSGCVWVANNAELERFAEMVFEAGRMYGIKQTPVEPVSQLGEE